VPLSLFAAQYNDFTGLWISSSSLSDAFIHTPRYFTWSKIVHVGLHHLERHLMGQVVHTFLGKKEHQLFCAIKSNFVFSSIVTTDIQKTLQPTNTGAEHAYIISKQ